MRVGRWWFFPCSWFVRRCTPSLLWRRSWLCCPDWCSYRPVYQQFVTIRFSVTRLKRWLRGCWLRFSWLSVKCLQGRQGSFAWFGFWCQDALRPSSIDRYLQSKCCQKVTFMLMSRLATVPADCLSELLNCWEAMMSVHSRKNWEGLVSRYWRMSASAWGRRIGSEELRALLMTSIKDLSWLFCIS